MYSDMSKSVAKNVSNSRFRSLNTGIVSQGKNHVVEENPSQFYGVKRDLFVFKMQSKSCRTKPRDNSRFILVIMMIVAYEVSHYPTK